MIYKNSIRIIFSRFNLVWKILLHLSIAALITLGFCALSALPIIKVLISENFFDNLLIIKNNIFPVFNLNGIINSITETVEQFFSIISVNLGDLFIFILLFLISLFILGGFLKGLYRVITCNVLYRFLTSNTTVGYCASIVETLKLNLKFELLAAVTILPINIINVLIVFATMELFTFGGVVSIITPFILMLIIIVMQALKLTIFSGWIPAMLTNNKGVVDGLKFGFKSTNRNFLKVFSNALALVVTFIVVNFFVAIFTLGVGLLISIPATYLMAMTFNMVTFFENQGISYYTESGNVVIPKKMEETEDIRKIKYIL